MHIKTTSESTNVLETFKRQWKLLKQPFPWKDRKSTRLNSSHRT